MRLKTKKISSSCPYKNGRGNYWPSVFSNDQKKRGSVADELRFSWLPAIIGLSSARRSSLFYFNFWCWHHFVNSHCSIRLPWYFLRWFNAIHEAIISHGSTPCLCRRERQDGLDSIACKRERNFIGARRNLHNTPAPLLNAQMFIVYKIYTRGANMSHLPTERYIISICLTNQWVCDELKHDRRPTDQTSEPKMFFTHKLIICWLPYIRGADARFSAVWYLKITRLRCNQEIIFECSGTKCVRRRVILFLMLFRAERVAS